MSQPYDVPLFGEPDPPKTERIRSRREQDDAVNKVSYIRYKGSEKRLCQDCYEEGEAYGAAYLRVHGQDQRPLCFRHRALRGEREALEAPRGQ